MKKHYEFRTEVLLLKHGHWYTLDGQRINSITKVYPNKITIKKLKDGEKYLVTIVDTFYKDMRDRRQLFVHIRVPKETIGLVIQSHLDKFKLLLNKPVPSLLRKQLNSLLDFASKRDLAVRHVFTQNMRQQMPIIA